MIRESQRSERADTAIFAAALLQALRQLDGDQRLSREMARALRAASASADRQAKGRVAFEPEKHLGPFEQLPPAARAAMVAAIADSDRWNVRGYELGEWHPRLLRLLWRLRQRIHRWFPADTRASRSAREMVDVLAYGARKAPAWAVASLHRQWLSARARFSSRPTLGQALSFAGIQPRDFAVCYARQVPQADRYRGHWHDPSRHVTVGRVIGIDFMPTVAGCWYVEGNVSPQLDGPRVDLHERDEFACSLIDFAAAHGYRHLTVLDNTSSSLPERMARQFESEAKARHIGVTLVELPNVPGAGHTRCFGIPPAIRDGTLVVRYRAYPSSLDYVSNTKRASYRALLRYRDATNDPDLLLPETGLEPPLADLAGDEPLPNVVYKLPEVEQGRGVYFLKAHSAAHARAILHDAIAARRQRELQDRVLHSVTDREGIFQAFVKSLMLEDRRLYKIRALVLVCPTGIRFLSAYRVVCAHPVPERLEYGVVRDPRPFLVNAARGGWLASCPADESASAARAATAVGRGLAWAAEYGFCTAAAAAGCPDLSPARCASGFQ